MKLRALFAVVVVASLTISVERKGAIGQEGLDRLTLPQDGRSRRASSTDANIDGNGDSKTILPGQTLTLADLDGPGQITHSWNTTASLNPFSGRSLVLRIYWDGAKRPSVEVPLGDFFGVGHGAKATFQSIPVGVSSHGRSRTCYWKMPFRKHAKETPSIQGTGTEDYFGDAWGFREFAGPFLGVSLYEKSGCAGSLKVRNRLMAGSCAVISER